ncbi:MAG: hypothetical protein H6708_31125 [Kofleriaceae bacterium]|nr:hypothetical protein [Myxococcales bacterium]MCB9564862.1 hypothetical protein [Kofleriaceae bacterium]
MRIAWISIAVVVAVGCDKPEATRVDKDPGPATSGSSARRDVTGPFGKGDNVAVAAPSGAGHADWIQPVTPVPWTRPDRPRNASEEALYGTWAARVGDYATRSAFMADRVVYALDGTNPDMLGQITDAIAHDDRLASACIWLELRPDFTGIRRECAIVNGEPSALDQNDPITGAKKDLGTPLEWYFDDTAHEVVIHFGADMVVPALRDGVLRTLVFRTWRLRLGDKVGDNTFTVTETLPEHDYVLPTAYPYEIFPQSFL